MKRLVFAAAMLLSTTATAQDIYTVNIPHICGSSEAIMQNIGKVYGATEREFIGNINNSNGEATLIKVTNPLNNQRVYVSVAVDGSGCVVIITEPEIAS